MPPRLSLFATAARGTEALLVDELTELGAKQVRQDRGGVRFLANLREALRICLWTRIAMRVLYPLGEYTAEGADGLYEAAHTVAWEQHLGPDTTFAIDATLRDAVHSHSGFVAQKIKDGLVDRLRERWGRRPNVDARHPQVRVVAHLVRSQLSLSMDLCGEPLHRRGYRVMTTQAPLKETLAAALLRAADYHGEEPLFDPMCGSGTLLLEAALIAKQRAPSLGRSFAVEQWPSLGPAAQDALGFLREEARAQERAAPHPIVGMDRNEDALAAVRRNTRALHLDREVRILEGDALKPWSLDVPRSGLLVTNPPYGERLRGGGQKGMKSFYFKLGENIRQLPGLRSFVLAGNPAFESAFHARPTSRRELFNGPIACTLLGYPARAHSDATFLPPEEPADVRAMGEQHEKKQESRQRDERPRTAGHRRHHQRGDPSQE
jgi:putative N6-adenine-specific DNA methylase